MQETTGTTIGIIPDVRGLGGPASFHQKFVSGLQKRHIQVSYDLQRTDLQAVLVIAGSRHLRAIASARRNGIPIIQRLDGMNWIHRRRYTGLKHFLRSEVNNWILQTIRKNLADKIIYQSRFSQDWWQREYGTVKQPSRIIYNGIDLESYAPSSRPVDLKDGIRLLAVEGHLKNGVETGLVNAACALQKWPDYRGIPIRLAVAGDVPQPVRSRIEEMLPGRMEWLGILPRAAIPGQLHQSHLFFSVELNPACPNAVIEALACGLPVLAFDSGAIRELVDSRSGTILPYDRDVWQLELADGSGLARSGSLVLDDLDAYRRQARLRAEEMFGLDQMVQSYLEVIFS